MYKWRNKQFSTKNSVQFVAVLPLECNTVVGLGHYVSTIFTLFNHRPSLRTLGLRSFVLNLHQLAIFSTFYSLLLEIPDTFVLLVLGCLMSRDEKYILVL